MSHATLSPTPADTLADELQDLELIREPALLQRYSRDFSWFSPVLKSFLEGRVADLVVRPKSEEETSRVVSSCARGKVPLTLRGSGTGNYGQATPLEGGVVMDLSACNQPLWLDEDKGIARVQCGMRLGDIDAWARPKGWEMRMVSSTFRLATAGGFYGGGFGGVGSIGYGPMGEIGNLLGVRVMSMEAPPRIEELRGREALDLHHAYGINGIITELEFALAPRLQWVEVAVAFPDFMDAARFAQAVTASGGLVKKEMAVFADPVPRLIGLGKVTTAAAPHLAVAVVAANAVEPVTELAGIHGGSVTEERDETVVAKKGTFIEYTWNHTTMRALKQEKQITYLQVRFEPGRDLDQVEHLYHHFGDEVPMHLEFIFAGGTATCYALPLVRFTSEQRLREIIAYHEQCGAVIADPHTHVLEDGNKKIVDERQLAMKRRLDPMGLLNPGKMRAWGNVHELPGAPA
jgi:FAD/FMN-containing dehydrogenase